MRIKKLLLPYLLIIVNVIVLTGCLESVELNKLGIVAGIAIDKTGDTYTVTLQIINPSAMAGESQNALPINNLKAEGDSIHEAFSKIRQLISSALYLSHLNVIIINEEFAKTGFSSILNFALRHADIRPDISIIVAKDDSAASILNVLTDLDMIPSAQLNISSRISSHTPRLTSSNLYETVDMVNTDRINCVLNAVSIYREDDHLEEEIKRKDGSEGKTSSSGSTIDNILDITSPVQLRIEHLAAFQGDKLAGFLNSYEAQFYNMVMGDKKRYIVVAKIEEDYYTSVRMPEVKSKISTDLANNEATIKMDVKAVILENTYPIDLTNTENLVVMSEHVKSKFEKDMHDFIEKVQTELKTDIFGIGGKAHHQENEVWQEKEGYWSEIFPELTINLEVELEISSVGEIGNVTL